MRCIHATYPMIKESHSKKLYSQFDECLAILCTSIDNFEYQFTKMKKYIVDIYTLLYERVLQFIRS